MSTPAPVRVTSPRRHMDEAQKRVIRDVAAVALMGGGVTSLAIVLFLVDPLAGFAFLSVLAIVAGIVLATDRI